MKKNFKFYFIIWAILFAVYNAVVFLVDALPGFVINYDGRFWVTWAAVIVAFIGQLFCAYTAFDSKNKEKLFLNLPLITQSYSALITTAVVSSLLMLIPDCPAWIAAVISITILVFSVIAIIKAKFAAEVVSESEDKIKVQTFFIKSLTVDADTLMAKAKSDSVKAECKKVYEAVRYSDPMSSDALSSVESEITIKFAKLSEAVAADSADAVTEIANELLILLGDRNKKCKASKQ